MSTAGRPEDGTPAPSDVAARLREAGLVRLVAAADGDALAGAGVLADGLGQLGVPFQLTVARPGERADRTTDADLTVALGGADVTAEFEVPGVPRAASHTAFETVKQFERSDPDALLALAGVTAAADAAGELPEMAGLKRAPGVAVPTAEPADGLAHSTLIHAPFSGDRDAAEEALADVDTGGEDAGRTVASLVTLSVLEPPAATPRAAERIERALYPYRGGPFETIGGYADVLASVAREAPGTAAALALGSDVTDEALSAWRTHAERAHTAVRAATTGRYDGLFVARGDGDVPVETVARLLADFRSPEPVVLVVTDSQAGLVATPDAGVDARRLFGRALDGAVAGNARRATASIDVDSADAIMAVRGAVQ